jgi:hypothetical protein
MDHRVLKGRFMVGDSIPNIPLIILHPIFEEKLPIFLLKSFPTVMILLTIDIRRQGG